LERNITPILMGGTGSRSEFEEQPDFMPDCYESGTMNTGGIAGLGGGVNFVLKKGIEEIRAREEQLTSLFIEGITSIPGIRVYGCRDRCDRIPVVSFTVDGVDPGEAALELDEQFDILSRPGLHCAPSAHKTIGSYPLGTIRFSFGYFNTDGQVHSAVDAVYQISKRGCPLRSVIKYGGTIYETH
ncbi:MAG: aminotransferase class V-fold PLP-dependent enzyme, partial [Deltaproteobacteria bacterium]|nr:aminotransferase class V-fold PLP-dependent enzyme [Deltaproteobacteria bacterium]